MELKLILNFMFKKGLQDSAVTKFRSFKKKKKKSKQINSKQVATKYKRQIQIQIKEHLVAEQKTL